MLLLYSKELHWKADYNTIHLDIMSKLLKYITLICSVTIQHTKSVVGLFYDHRAMLSQCHHLPLTTFLPNR